METDWDEVCCLSICFNESQCCYWLMLCWSVVSVWWTMNRKKNKGKEKEKAKEARREDAVGNFLLNDNEMGMILNFEFPG